ncbi:MAG: SCO family protein [Anaerolineae bacterium]|nr:MAG: SCO family protein [Anaerolineae bacterium]
MKRSLPFFLIGLLAGLVLILALLFPRLKPHTFAGTVLQSPEAAPDFTLQSAQGTVSLHDFRGKVVLLYFGYTFCPDVCPTTLAELKTALDVLGRQADSVQVIMISVDPERDTPEVLQRYMEHFHPDFIGVTGELDKIKEIATLYGVYFEKAEGDSEKDYLVNHTATVMAIDPEGYLKLIFPYGTSGEAIAADVAYMLR